MHDWESLNSEIVACARCPRLVVWRNDVARMKRRSFAEETYWGRPVPNFGDPTATRLIVGLAPAAHGANRTGRMFTGDRSGEWLYRALHRAGLANQPDATHVGDGLALKGVAITAVCHCAPPANRPNKEEIVHCRPYLMRTLNLARWDAILCLGALAWAETHRCLGVVTPKFSHGYRHTLPGGPAVIASYHPSQQNTFTGRLTEAMFDEVIGAFAVAGP